VKLRQHLSTIAAAAFILCLTGAQGVANAQTAPDYRWSVDFGIGFDNSISGNINSGAIGTLNNQAVVITKNKYEDVIRSLQPMLPTGVRSFPLSDSYPSGDEFLLVHDVTRRVIPPGGLPRDVGALVVNVETLVNVGLGQPVTHKYLTIAGDVPEPVTVRAPIGASFGDVLRSAGADPDRIGRVPVVAKVEMANFLPDDPESHGIDVPTRHVTAQAIRLDEWRTTTHERVGDLETGEVVRLVITLGERRRARAGGSPGRAGRRRHRHGGASGGSDRAASSGAARRGALARGHAGGRRAGRGAVARRNGGAGGR